ncbi:hypothetical protein C0J52_04644 [Blattella germanica]|nr:hypothetical protein C0J52_04644 [Blattella germanica]
MVRIKLLDETKNKYDLERHITRFIRSTRDEDTQRVENEQDDDEEERLEELLWCCNIPPDNMMKNETAREKEQREDEKIIQECRTEVTNILGGFGKQSDGYTCNPAANNFNHCVYDMMNLYCPDKQKPFSKRCDKHREMLKMRYEP